MLDKGLGVIGFLAMVNVLLLLAGNVMEPSSIVLIMAPICSGRGEAGDRPDPLRDHDRREHGSGHVPPAVGLNLYVSSGITKMGIHELTIAVWPWLLTMLVFLVIVTYWPPLSLWLPRTLGMIPNERPGGLGVAGATPGRPFGAALPGRSSVAPAARSDPRRIKTAGAVRGRLARFSAVALPCADRSPARRPGGRTAGSRSAGAPAAAAVRRPDSGAGGPAAAPRTYSGPAVVTRRSRWTGRGR